MASVSDKKDTDTAIDTSTANTPNTNDTKTNDYSDQTDEQFEQWVLRQLTALAPELEALYPSVFPQASQAVRSWRQRYQGNPSLWNRLFKPQKVFKEVVESIPVVATALDWFDQNTNNTNKITILDLCSGKGYLSMLLSEILPKDRVEKCLLLDYAWAQNGSEPQPHHMAWDHIYGDPYFHSWPIPLLTSKQDLKKSRTIRQLTDRLTNNNNENNTSTQVLILAVHLCGTLSIQAIRLFQALPNAPLLLLKPCCLPGMDHVKLQDQFQIGTYCFPTSEVCSAGKWTGSNKSKSWKGPPRWQLQPKFQQWCFHLQQAVDAPASDATTRMDTKRLELPIQTNGGFQNFYLVANKKENEEGKDKNDN